MPRRANDTVDSGNRDPGISRGMDSVAAKTVFSRRFGYVEPYTRLLGPGRLPAPAAATTASRTRRRNLRTHPPLVGRFALGIEVIPCERREQFQRLIGRLPPQGHLPLAGARLLRALRRARLVARRPRSRNPDAPTAYRRTPPRAAEAVTSVADPSAQSVSTSPASPSSRRTAASRSRLRPPGRRASTSSSTLGVGFTYAQIHLITAGRRLQPERRGSSPGAAGPCTAPPASATTSSNGVPNPDHRDVIDLPGTPLLGRRHDHRRICASTAS